MILVRSSIVAPAAFKAAPTFLKTWLRGTFPGVSPKHLQRYLDEFVFRFDRRWQETELFIRVLHRALDTAPCPYHQLTAV